MNRSNKAVPVVFSVLFEREDAFFSLYSNFLCEESTAVVFESNVLSTVCTRGSNNTESYSALKIKITSCAIFSQFLLLSSSLTCSFTRARASSIVLGVFETKEVSTIFKKKSTSLLILEKQVHCPQFCLRKMEQEQVPIVEAVQLEETEHPSKKQRVDEPSNQALFSYALNFERKPSPICFANFDKEKSRSYNFIKGIKWYFLANIHTKGLQMERAY